MSEIRDHLVKFIEKGHYSKKELAAKLNYSLSSLHDYLQHSKDKPYRGSLDAIERAVYSFLRREGEYDESDDNAVARYINTTASRRVCEACTAAQEERAFKVVVGDPGVGKTRGLMEWERQARKDGISYAKITANITTHGSVAVTRKLALALGLSVRGTSHEILDRIFAKLYGDPATIIIDEAQHLRINALEAVRAIHDEAGVGVALVGSNQLYYTLTLKDNDRSELAQLVDRAHGGIERVGKLNPFEVANFVTLYFEEKMNPEVIGAFSRACDRYPRRLVRVMALVQRMLRGKRLSAKELEVGHVEEAHRRLITGGADDRFLDQPEVN